MGLLLATALLQLVCWLLPGFDPMVSREHGPLENFQVVCLVLGAVIFLREAARSTGGPVRLMALGLALLPVLFLVMEVDVRSFAPPAWVNSLLNGTIRDAWLGLLWVAWGVAVWLARLAVLPAGWSWMASRSGLVMIYAGIFWNLGALIEKGRLFSRADLTRLGEEAMEVCAAAFMLLAALLFQKGRPER